MTRALRNGRAVAAVAPAPVRCAIYTRKSTDEGLDRDFNSLDNQRERAEDYIRSQREQGWELVPDRYEPVVLPLAHLGLLGFQRYL